MGKLTQHSEILALACLLSVVLYGLQLTKRTNSNKKILKFDSLNSYETGIVRNATESQTLVKIKQFAVIAK